ncbi:MAG: lipopolysaccharide biosynthesis protein [Pseudomonadales bacterium]|nr:lipopolysaccharide biosynthesis protein [Pseudomonadales bacterium]
MFCPVFHIFGWFRQFFIDSAKFLAEFFQKTSQPKSDLKKRKQCIVLSNKSEKYKQFFDTTHLKADLKGKSVRGGTFVMGGQISSCVVRLGLTMVLARILTPDDYGLIAMVAVVTNFAMMFKDMGLSMATVQRSEITHEQVSTLFWINLGLSVLIGIVLAALAPLVAWFYKDPRLLFVTIALAGMFPLSGLSIQHSALLIRQMRFGALSVIQITGVVISGIVAMIAAWQGMRYWSLVLMQLVIPLWSFIAIWWICPWRPAWFRLGVGARSMMLFGGNLTGFNFMNYFSRNADNLLIGKFLGTQLLGLYDKAYQLLMLPLRQITYPVSNVAVPALSRLQEDPEGYQRYYYKMIKIIAYITMPLIAFMAVLSDDVILLMLGEQWRMTSPVFKILAFAAFLQPVSATTGPVFISMGLTNRMFRWGVFSSIMTVLAFVIGIKFGIKGVATAYAISCYILFVPNLIYTYAKTPVKFGKVIQILVPPVLLSVVLYFLIELMKYNLHQEEMLNIIISIGIAVLTGMLAFCLSRQVRADFTGIYQLFLMKKKS